MKHSLKDHGFTILRKVIDAEQIAQFRTEAEEVSASVGSVCVRHLRARSALFRELSISPTLTDLLPEGMRPVRSILFDKTAADNWPVPWHQDLTIAVAEKCFCPGYRAWTRKDGAWHVQPPIGLLERMITIRLHLDDTPSSNGALKVIPGSHKWGKLDPKRLLDLDPSNAIACACAAGDAMLMSPLLLHSSSRSTSPMKRRVLHMEYAREVDLDEPLAWLDLG